MMKENVINELRSKGYDAIAQDHVKNGVVMEGICIKSEGKTVYPVFYIGNYIKRDYSPSEIAEKIIFDCNRNDFSDSNLDVDKFFDKEFILENVYVGLQRKSDQDCLVTKSCVLEGTELYMHIRQSVGNEAYSVKITQQLLDKVEITPEEVWGVAERNTISETKIDTLVNVIMSNVISKQEDEEMAECVRGMLEEQLENQQLYVLTNNSCHNGASSIIDKKILSEFGKEHGVDKVFILPSSIHEVLMMPYSEDVDIDALTDMVIDVNATQVEPEERLADTAYVISV